MGAPGGHDGAAGLIAALAGGAALRKRSISVAGHPTSVSLEEPFWTVLKWSARERGLSLAALVAEVDAGRATNLSSALRVHALRALAGMLSRPGPSGCPRSASGD